MSGDGHKNRRSDRRTVTGLVAVPPDGDADWVMSTASTRGKESMVSAPVFFTITFLVLVTSYRKFFPKP